jgi:drug/metabolite transporter (DMT)-like permease
MYPQDHLKGAFLMTLSALMFAGMGACIKVAARDIPNDMVVFLRNCFGLIYLLPWLLRGGLAPLKTQRFGMHLFRTLIGLSAMYCFFYAIAHMELSGAVLLNFSAPLFVPVIAWFWLKEKVPSLVRLALVIGFTGIVLILRPAPGAFNAAAFIGMWAGIFAATAMVSIRRMSNTEPTTRIVFYYSVICTLVSSLPVLWHWTTPDTKALLLMIGAGIFATNGQLLMTRAYAHAPAARVGPFMYLTVVFAGLIGWWLWLEIPDGLALLGMLMVITAGIITLQKKLQYAEELN